MTPAGGRSPRPAQPADAGSRSSISAGLPRGGRRLRTSSTTTCTCSSPNATCPGGVRPWRSCGRRTIRRYCQATEHRAAPSCTTSSWTTSTSPSRHWPLHTPVRSSRRPWSAPIRTLAVSGCSIFKTATCSHRADPDAHNPTAPSYFAAAAAVPWCRRSPAGCWTHAPVRLLGPSRLCLRMSASIAPPAVRVV